MSGRALVVTGTGTGTRNRGGSSSSSSSSKRVSGDHIIFRALF